MSFKSLFIHHITIQQNTTREHYFNSAPLSIILLNYYLSNVTVPIFLCQTSGSISLR